MFFYLLSSKAQWCSDEKTICFCLCFSNFYCRILSFLVNFMLFHSLSFIFSKALMHCLFLLFLFLEKEMLLEWSFWELFFSTRRWTDAHDFKFSSKMIFFLHTFLRIINNKIILHTNEKKLGLAQDREEKKRKWKAVSEGYDNFVNRFFSDRLD